MIDITFLGDFCPINRIDDIIKNSEFKIFDNVKSILKNSDFNIVNLECPITNSTNKINKIGPNLKASPNTIKLIDYLGVNIAALANNHIFDYSAEGLFDTINILNNHNISYLGAGLQYNELIKPLILDKNDISVCIINVCEKEFNNFDGKGANTFNFFDTFKTIKDNKEKCDYIIIFFHGGLEMYNLPTPEMYKLFDFFIEIGVDIIVCNHQHVFSGYKYYNNKFISYGLGNFMFDWPNLRNSPWNYGYMLNLQLYKKKEIKFNIIPYKQFSSILGLEINEDVKNHVNKELIELNENINMFDLINSFNNFSSIKEENYYANLYFKNKYIKYIAKKTGFLKFIKNKSYNKRLLNYLDCQSHKELLINILKKE